MSTPFVIVGAARTGSTLLVRTLNSLDGVRCHGELLGPDNVRGFEDGFDPAQASAPEREARLERLNAERAADPPGFIQRALSGEGSAVGFKALYSAILAPRWHAVRDALLSRDDIHYIHLVRRNGLRRFVSEQILLAGGPIHSGAGGRSESRRRIEIDIDDFKRTERDLADQAADVERLLSGKPLLALSYEELAADTAESMAKTCAFLDIAPPPPGIEPPLSKVGAQDLSEVVDNFEELLRDEATRRLALDN